MENEKVSSCRNRINELTDLIQETMAERDNQIETVKEFYAVKIKDLREERQREKAKCYYYETEGYKPKTDYTQTVAFSMFGKRMKDLNSEEMREYLRIRKQVSRARDI